MSKEESIKVAHDSMAFSNNQCDIAEFLYFFNRTQEQGDMLCKARRKLVWDIKTYGKIIKQTEHGGN